MDIVPKETTLSGEVARDDRSEDWRCVDDGNAVAHGRQLDTWRDVRDVKVGFAFQRCGVSSLGWSLRVFRLEIYRAWGLGFKGSGLSVWGSEVEVLKTEHV